MNHLTALDEDKVNSMLFDVEYEIISKTEELIKVLKNASYPKDRYEEIEALIEKRYNLIGACLVFDYEDLK